MSNRVWITLAVAVSTAATLSAAQTRGGTGRATTPAKPATPPSVERRAACASNLGEGVKSKKAYCDVIIAAMGAESVSLEIPPHTGPSMLYFDLHPRFEVSQPDGDPARLFQRHAVVVAIVGPTGDVIERVGTDGEYRSTADLAERLPGQGPGGFKVVAPGQPARTIKVQIPASISAIGIVGLRVEIQNRFNFQVFPEPGRPVAIVSNWRIEYTAR
jgi:hypothetical protein